MNKLKIQLREARLLYLPGIHPDGQGVGELREGGALALPYLENIRPAGVLVQIPTVPSQRDDMISPQRLSRS